jgi:DHA3 family macrolide efflux protein-like MFS transporter
MKIQAWRQSPLLLFSGQFLSQICDKMASLGLLWVLKDRFSGSSLAIFLALSGLPHLLLFKKSAEGLQKYSPRRLMIISDLGRAALFLFFAVMLMIEPELPLGVFLSLIFLVNVAAAFFNPAILTLPAQWGDEKKTRSLTALVQFCVAISPVLGPLFCSLLFARVGLSGVALTTGVAYLIAAGTALALQVPSEKNIEDNPPGFDWKIIQAQREIFILLASFLLMNLFSARLFLALPIYVEKIFKGDLQTYASLEMSLGLGMVCGSLILSLLKVKFERKRAIFSALGLSSVFFLGFSISSNLDFSLAALFLLGFFVSFANVLILEHFQLEALPRSLSSVMVSVNLISVAALPLSMLLASLWNIFVDMQTLLIISATAYALTIAASVLLLRKQGKVQEQKI